MGFKQENQLFLLWRLGVYVNYLKILLWIQEKYYLTPERKSGQKWDNEKLYNKRFFKRVKVEIGRRNNGKAWFGGGVGGAVRVETGRFQGHRDVFSFSTSLGTFMTKINNLQALAV